LGDERVAPALVTALKHPNPYIRLVCIQALGKVGTREDLPALAAIQLYDESPVNVNNGFDVVSLKTAAATAAHKIRTRHHLTP
jgi:hypothetical protein